MRSAMGDEDDELRPDPGTIPGANTPRESSAAGPSGSSSLGATEDGDSIQPLGGSGPNLRGSSRRTQTPKAPPSPPVAPVVNVQVPSTHDFKITLESLTSNSSLYKTWRLKLRGVLTALHGLEPQKGRDYWDS